MLSDTATLSFTLTYAGTLAVALLMFIGQLTAFGILLALVGTARLVAYPLKTAARSFTKPDHP
ncbi:hypothetical protein [Pseudarthrobacter sp. AB1]|uniref:hypothetical protein n=1 Tax=Pseudarthrobacter sp. AB1 TaxID=2138309 RepID=UPI00186B74E8|nr:hypothetical protein [Pseudarthrobacter sp. AB1]MBE4718985.1 hypothetical protein [Pseudarthrobacter sp. AB1]